MRGNVYSREETMSTLDKNHLGKATLEANLSPFSSSGKEGKPFGENHSERKERKGEKGKKP